MVAPKIKELRLSSGQPGAVHTLRIRVNQCIFIRECKPERILIQGCKRHRLALLRVHVPQSTLCFFSFVSGLLLHTKCHPAVIQSHKLRNLSLLRTVIRQKLSLRRDQVIMPLAFHTPQHVNIPGRIQRKGWKTTKSLDNAFEKVQRNLPQHLLILVCFPDHKPHGAFPQYGG